MKTKHKIILGITGLFALIGGGLGFSQPDKALGATCLFGRGGGTGICSVTAGDVGKYLKILDDSPLTYGFDSASGGSQTPWTQNIVGAGYSLSGVGSLDATSSVITQATSTNLAVTSLTSAILLTNGNGTLAEYGGSACGAGTKADSISALGVVTCTAVDISTFTNLTGDTEIVLTGDALSIASTITRDTELVGLSNSKWATSSTWIVPNVAGTGLIVAASSTIDKLTSTISTSTAATSTDFFSTRGLISTFLFGNATGTNLFASQAIFTRASSTQATTTNFFTNSLMSIISNLGKATSSSMAVTGEATTSSMTISNKLRMIALKGQGVSLGVNSSGIIYGSATSSNFVATPFASSSMGSGTTTVSLGGYFSGATFTKMGCTGRGSGTFTAVIGDGTASSTYVVSGTSLTTSYTTLSSNNTFTSGEMIFWAIGSVSGTVGYPSCSFVRD